MLPSVRIQEPFDRERKHQQKMSYVRLTSMYCTSSRVEIALDLESRETGIYLRTMHLNDAPSKNALNPVLEYSDCDLLPVCVQKLAKSFEKRRQDARYEREQEPIVEVLRQITLPMLRAASYTCLLSNTVQNVFIVLISGGCQGRKELDG